MGRKSYFKLKVESDKSSHAWNRSICSGFPVRPKTDVSGENTLRILTKSCGRYEGREIRFDYYIYNIYMYILFTTNDRINYASDFIGDT